MLRSSLGYCLFDPFNLSDFLQGCSSCTSSKIGSAVHVNRCIFIECDRNQTFAQKHLKGGTEISPKKRRETLEYQILFPIKLQRQSSISSSDIKRI